MASQHVERLSARQQARQHAYGKTLKERFQPLLRFWRKFSNDWVFNFSGLLAYNFLISIFPILLALLAVGGFILNNIPPGNLQELSSAIAETLPGGASGTGGQIVHAALKNLQRQAGPLFIIALLVSIFTGSRLFVVIENCFGVIFRLRGRTLIRQNLVAIGMLLLYIVLVPIIFLASIIPAAVVNALHATGGTAGLSGLLIQLVGLVTAFIVALVFFGAIYVIVPNRPVHFYEVWKGTLVAAGLLVLYESLFPIYQSFALRPGNYGAAAGFAIVILVFFYYLAVILLLGAEINSWASGQRETAGDIATILHQVQAHNTTRGAAGPTAGMPQEDLVNRESSQPMAKRGGTTEHEHTNHGDKAGPEAAQPGKVADGRSLNGAVSGQISGPSDAGTTGDMSSAPYAYDATRQQRYQTHPIATRREEHGARPNAEARRPWTRRALAVALAAGVAAAALWLQRRDD